MTVSDFACERRAAYVLVTGDQCNRDLRLQRICSEALIACGYTEAALSSVLETFREPEFDSPWLTSSGGFSDHSSCNACERKRNICLNVDLSDYEKQPTDNEIAQSDEFSDVTDSKLSAKASDNEEQSKNIKFIQRPARSFTTHYEQSILENDAKIWQDSRPRLHIRDVIWRLDMG